jgi:hypothetical protein
MMGQAMADGSDGISILGRTRVCARACVGVARYVR